MVKPNEISDVAVLTQAISVRSCASRVRSTASLVPTSNGCALGFVMASRPSTQVPPPTETPGGATNQQVGYARQQEGDDQRLIRVEPAKLDVLVDRVDDHRHHEHVGDRLPALAKPCHPVR